MKIGIFTECYKPTINGVVMSIESFREELEKMGHQVFIFAPKYHKTGLIPNVFRIPSITLPSPKDYPVALPFLYPSLLREAASSLKLDIIHTQHIFSMGGAGQNVAKMLHIPTVHTYHTMMTEYTHYFPIKPLRSLVKKYIISRSRKFCNRADKIIVPSSPMIEVLKSYGVTQKIEVLPTGIKLQNYRKISKNERQKLFNKFHIPLGKEILMFVGRLAREKNLDFLLECFVKILISRPDTHLILVGSGPYQANLKLKIKKLKLASSVTLTGFLKKEDSNLFFGAGDIFVFPSTTDTQGIVLAESLAAGTPVVAISKLGPKDIIKNNQDGFLVPLNKKAFSDKILGLQKNPDLRQKFSQNGIKNAKQFSSRVCAAKLVKIYRETISEYQEKNDFTRFHFPNQNTTTKSNKNSRS